jgi:alpha,alpha-trehalase
MRSLVTADRIEEELAQRHLVQRWSRAGDEGAFVICSYWLAAARAMAGQVDQAKAAFDALTACANDVGLLSEAVDRRDGSPIGNFPQALSHIGLIKRGLGHRPGGGKELNHGTAARQSGLDNGV